MQYNILVKKIFQFHFVSITSLRLLFLVFESQGRSEVITQSAPGQNNQGKNCKISNCCSLRNSCKLCACVVIKVNAAQDMYTTYY